MRIILFRFIIPFFIIGLFILVHFYSGIDWKITDYLSFLMILLTYFYVVFTYEMLHRLETQSYLEKRPYLIADFTSERRILKVYVKNIGKTPAYNVEVKLIPDLHTHSGQSLNQTLFKNKIAFFPPEKKVETIVETFIDFFKKGSYQFQIELTYQDNFNENYKEMINVDLGHIEEQSGLVNKTTNDIVKSLDKLTKVLANRYNNEDS